MIFDTGPLFAAAFSKDPDHEVCARLLQSTKVVAVPGPVIAEVGFLLGKSGGPRAEAAFLRSISAPKYRILNPTGGELRRAAQLVEQYGDLPLGTTDAVVMAMAESRNDPAIATLDRRHFTVVRPAGFPTFQIVPD
ncbi:MAG TPA: PIN domain-containing protein [Ilumatobacter sp.]|nr:PIN domain-containing protein [Ilumatobacter sp.]